MFNGSHPYQSVNDIACLDGCVGYDPVSYQDHEPLPPRSLGALQPEHVLSLFESMEVRKKRTARLFGIGRVTLYRLLDR